MHCAFHSTSLLSICTLTIMSPFLWNADCPVFKWLASCSRSGGIPFISPHSLSTFCLTTFQLISNYYITGLIDVMILA
jgi:hypothetical protein